MLKQNLKCLFILTFCFTSSLFAVCPHNLHLKQAPSLIHHYHLHDLGESGLQPADLTKIKDGASLAPCINNCGEITGNRAIGGFIQKPDGAAYNPTLNGGKYIFHSINTHGDILVSIQRSKGNVDWLIWESHSGYDGKRIPIDTLEVQGENLQLLKINDDRLIAGEASPVRIDLPLMWYPNYGLYRVGHFQGLNVHGKVKDINRNGWLVGKSHRCLENFPYIWDGRKIFDLSKQRNRFRPPSDGKIVFEDMVLSDDGIVYGTFWINTKFMENDSNVPENIQAYIWDLSRNTIETFDWDGMRIAAINKFHRAVGTVDGKAVFAEKNFSPTELSSTIPVKELDDWELIEATDINDMGQIVGYGRKNGKIHLFFANPSSF